MEQMLTRISGIPCLLRVVRVYIQAPDRGADNRCDYEGYSEIEYTVCDRRGRPAPWLERKLTEADEARIEGEILCWMSEIAET